MIKSSMTRNGKTYTISILVLVFIVSILIPLSMNRANVLQHITMTVNVAHADPRVGGTGYGGSYGGGGNSGGTEENYGGGGGGADSGRATNGGGNSGGGGGADSGQAVNGGSSGGRGVTGWTGGNADHSSASGSSGRGSGSGGRGGRNSSSGSGSGNNNFNQSSRSGSGGNSSNNLLRNNFQEKGLNGNGATLIQNLSNNKVDISVYKTDANGNRISTNAVDVGGQRSSFTNALSQIISGLNRNGLGYNDKAKVSITKDQYGNITVTTNITCNGFCFTSFKNASGAWGTVHYKEAPSTNTNTVTSNPPPTVVDTCPSDTTLVSIQNVVGSTTYSTGKTQATGQVCCPTQFVKTVTTGSGKGAQTTTTCVIPTPPVASVSCSPSSIPIGQSATINWSCANSDSSSGTNFSTNGSTSGSVSVSPLSNTTYSLSCSNGTGTTQQTAASSCNVTIAPACDALGNCPVTPTTTSVLCDTPGCTTVIPPVTCDALGNCTPVNVVSGPLTAIITAKPSLVNMGKTTTIMWNVGGAESCTVSGSNGDQWNGTNTPSHITSPIQGETTYTLTCVSPTGESITNNTKVYIVPSWQQL